MKRIHKNMNYPPTDLVILAGGQARRMNGINKLLQKFDDEIQLIRFTSSSDHALVRSGSTATVITLFMNALFHQSVIFRMMNQAFKDL